MERLQKAAILIELADRLRREGSWCGHTHMQKATLYVTRELGDSSDAGARAGRLQELKPHVSPADTRAAVQELDRIGIAAKAMVTDPTHV
ncbi:MAG: hypothetical protein ACHRXM_09725 [Isosphaerales bacterium]